MKILISGSGIAGLTLAYWLYHQGQQPLVIEQAPQLRDDGFTIDFFGAGYAVAERMHLLANLAAIHCPIPRLTFVDKGGNERISLTYEAFRTLLNGRLFSFMRGGLVQLLYETIKAQVPVRFATSIAAIEQDISHAHVTFTDGTSDTFDLVVGADGVHSQLRRLVFGDEEKCRHFLGYYTASFVSETKLVPRDAAYTLLVPRRRISISPLHEERCAILFLYRASRQPDTSSTDAIMRELQTEYGELGWIVPELLTQAQQARYLHFDGLTQIMLSQWSKGRVALVGDACQCVSPAAGQGASLAMVSAYVLARELATVSSSEVSLALTRYEQRIKPAIERKQQVGQRMAHRFFAPDNHFYLAMQNLNLRMMTWPILAPLIKQSFAWNNGFKL